MTYKAVKLVKRKLNVFKKYKNVRQPAYIKASRGAATESRRSKRNFETTPPPKLGRQIPAKFCVGVPRKPPQTLKIL